MLLHPSSSLTQLFKLPELRINPNEFNMAGITEDIISNLNRNKINERNINSITYINIIIIKILST